MPWRQQLGERLGEPCSAISVLACAPTLPAQGGGLLGGLSGSSRMRLDDLGVLRV